MGQSDVKRENNSSDAITLVHNSSTPNSTGHVHKSSGQIGRLANSGVPPSLYRGVQLYREFLVLPPGGLHYMHNGDSAYSPTHA